MTIPGNVVHIGFSAFSRCTELVSLTIREGVRTIGSYAFEGCEKLTSVVIPDSVFAIDNYAFTESGLERIVIPNGTAVRRFALRELPEA